MTDALNPMIEKLGGWIRLDQADRAALAALPHNRKRFSPHGYIVHDGDRPTQSCLLLSGFAYRQKTTGDGGRQILAVQLPGDLVDLQNSLLRVADHSVQALSHVEVAFIPREAIVQLAFDRPNVGMAMWYDTLVDGSIAREWTTNIGQRDARQRLAHLLCEFALRLEAAGLGNRTDYKLPLTQEQLADATGLTAVHVNRCVRWLDGEAIVDRAHRAIRIVDWQRLAQIGDFDSAYLHLDARSARQHAA